MAWVFVYHGTYTLFGAFGGPGPVDGLVASGTLTSTRAGEDSLKIRLTGAGRRLLRDAGALRLKAVATFAAPGQAAVETQAWFRLAG